MFTKSKINIWDLEFKTEDCNEDNDSSVEDEDEEEEEYYDEEENCSE